MSEPDYRAMWEGLQQALRGEVSPGTLGVVGDYAAGFLLNFMAGMEAIHEPDPDHAPRRSLADLGADPSAGITALRTPDPDHTPAVRRVVAWVEAIRWAADAFQSDALHAPMGASFQGGPLHGASVYNVNDRAARKLRELATALERDPDIWGQSHALRHRDEGAGYR